MKWPCFVRSIAALSCTGLAGIALAQGYPSKPIRMVNPEAFVHQEIQRYGELVRRAGVKME